MNYKKISILLGMVLLTASIAGCAATENGGTDSLTESAREKSASSGAAGTESTTESGSTKNSASSAAAANTSSIDGSEMFTNRDKEIGYDESTAVKITLSDNGSSSDSAAVTINQNTITISKEGTYILTGSLSNGQIIVDAGDSDKVQLVLDGVFINCDTSAAIYVREADKVFVTLAAGTTNTLSNTSDFVDIDDNHIDAVIFSKSDLTLNGNGTLAVTAKYGHGILSKDDLKITSGTYTVTAASSALSGKDSVRIADGVFELIAGSDGIHSENSDDTEKGYIYIAGGDFTVSADSDGIDSSAYTRIDGGTFRFTVGDDAVHASAELVINDGTIDILKSYEGLEGETITINGGSIDLYATDDGLNAAGGNDQSGFGGMGKNDMFRSSSSNSSIIINGGVLHVNSDGDGIDSNGSLTVNGGEITVDGPTNNGNGALDYDSNAVITGGTIVAVGASGMAQNFGIDSTQGSILVNLQSFQSAGSQITLKDSSGNVLVSYTAAKTYNSVLISSPDIKKGETYTLTTGSSEMTVTMDSLIYGSGMGGFGDGMGGPGNGNMGGGFGGKRGGFSGNSDDTQNGGNMQRGGFDGSFDGQQEQLPGGMEGFGDSQDGMGGFRGRPEGEGFGDSQGDMGGFGGPQGGMNDFGGFQGGMRGNRQDFSGNSDM